MSKLHLSNDAPARLIVVYSEFPQAGKTVVADRLVEKFDFRRLNFTALPEKMLVTLLINAGYPGAQAENLVFYDKDVCLSRISGQPTARWMLKTLYEGWGRDDVHTQLWAYDWFMKAGVWIRSRVNVVADGINFPEELEVARSLGCKFWRIERPDIEMCAADKMLYASRPLARIKPDKLIVNDGTIGKVHNTVDRAIIARKKKAKE